MIYFKRGDSTVFNNTPILSIELQSDYDMSNWTAEVILHNITRRYNDLSTPFGIIFTPEETNSLSIGEHNITIKVIDEQGNTRILTDTLTVYATDELLENTQNTQSFDLTGIDNSTLTIQISGEVDLSDYAKTDDIPTKISQLENDSNYLTEHQSLEDYAKVTDIPTVPTNVSSFKNDSGYLTSHQSLEGYATKEQLSTKQDKGDYALKSDIPTVPTNVSAFNNDKGYLTEHQDLSAYALKSEVATVDTSNFATKEDLANVTIDTSVLETAISNKQDKGDYVEFSDLSDVATSGLYGDLQGKPTIPTKTSELTNDSGFLTEHQDLSKYALKSEIPESSSSSPTGLWVTPEETITTTILSAVTLEHSINYGGTATEIDLTDIIKETGTQYELQLQIETNETDSSSALAIWNDISGLLATCLNTYASKKTGVTLMTCVVAEKKLNISSYRSNSTLTLSALRLKHYRVLN